MNRAASFLLCALISLVSPNLRAQGPQKLAAKSFRKGEQAFRQRDFVAAGLAFERAASILPHPSALLNASEAWVRAGQLIRAAKSCDRVLSLPDVLSVFQLEARRRLKRIESRLGFLDLQGSAAFEVSVDNQAPMHPPVRVRVEPGVHRLSIAGGEDGKNQEIETRVGRGETKVVALDLSPKDPIEPEVEAEVPRAAEPVEPTSAAIAADAPLLESEALIPGPEEGVLGPPLESWVALGVGAASLAVGLTFAGLTLDAESDYGAVPTQEGADRFFARRLTTNVAFVVSGISAAAGIGLWILRPFGEEEEEDAVEASVSLGPWGEGGGLLLGRIRY